MFYLFYIANLFSLFSKKKNKTVIIFLIFLLMLLSFFRFGIGTDYFNYGYLYYANSDSLSYELFFNEYAQQEVGFRVIIALFHKFNLGYQLFLSIIAVVTLIYLYKYVSKYSVNPILSILIYFSFFFLTWGLSGIRQGIVLTLGVYYMVNYLKDKKIWKFILIIGLLSLIHKSVIFLLIYIVVFKFLKLNLIRSIMYISFGIIFYILPINIDVTPLLWLDDNISVYQNATDNYFSLIIRIVLVLPLLLFYNKYKHDKFILSLSHLYIIGLLFYLFLNFMGETLSARVAIYGRFLEILLIPYLLTIIRNKYLLVISYLILLCILVFSFQKEGSTFRNQTQLNYEGSLVPYISIFDSNRYEYFDSWNYYMYESTK